MFAKIFEFLLIDLINFLPESSCPTIDIKFVFTPKLFKLLATFPAPPGIRKVLSTFIIGIGASGEILSTLHKTYLSSIKSPITRTITFPIL